MLWFHVCSKSTSITTTLLTGRTKKSGCWHFHCVNTLICTSCLVLFVPWKIVIDEWSWPFLLRLQTRHMHAGFGRLWGSVRTPHQEFRVRCEESFHAHGLDSILSRGGFTVERFFLWLLPPFLFGRPQKTTDNTKAGRKIAESYSRGKTVINTNDYLKGQLQKK